MNLLDFSRIYPDEESCESALRKFRERHGLFCSQCGGLRLNWNPSHKSWTCADCGHEITLRSGTVMQGSKLPVYDWFAAMFLMTVTRRAISSREIQRQLGRKRYQPVWEMVHKLREGLGKRGRRYQVCDAVAVDEGFFPTETPAQEKDCPLKRGHGSQRKTAVLVMAESSPAGGNGKHRKYSTGKKVGHVKMEVLNNLKASTEEMHIARGTEKGTRMVTDASRSYISLERHGLTALHESVIMKDKCKVGKVLPWVHIAISNAKRSILDTYHDIKAEFMQLYLNEFCYKFNRRFFGFRLFDRLELCACKYQADFKHRIY